MKSRLPKSKNVLRDLERQSRAYITGRKGSKTAKITPIVSQSQAKRIAIQRDEPCMCRVHLFNDKKSYLTCLGHGKGCPCTAKKEVEENAK